MTLADVHCTDHGNAKVATVAGEIDLSNTQSIRRVITQAMPNGLLVLILDLSRVDFFDSAGIQLIYQLREDLRARGQVLQLVIPSSSPTNDAFSLAGLPRHVEVLATLDDALRGPLIRGASSAPER